MFTNTIEKIIDIRLGGSKEYSNNHIIRNGSNHIAVVLRGNSIISIGVNSYKSATETIHAECSAIDKLPNNKGKNKKVDILVIRTSFSRKLGNSKPCIMCLDHMYNYAATMKGYKINNVYYSDECGNIQTKKLNHLIFNDKLHLSKMQRKNNIKHPWLSNSCQIC